MNSMFWDRFRRKQTVIMPENDKKEIIKPDNDKLDQILLELKTLYVLLSKHDKHLENVEYNIITRISDIMVKRKAIPEVKKAEVENILKDSVNRQDAITKLMAIGVSQASAYRYTDFLRTENDKKEIILSENDKKEDSQLSET